VQASNASLNEILREVGHKTGIKITGGVADDKVFGSYGPSSPAVVLDALLDGTGSNVLLVDDPKGGSELILTPRRGGVTPPNPNASQQSNESEDTGAGAYVPSLTSRCAARASTICATSTSHSAQHAHRGHRPLRLRQKLARLRHHLRRGPAPLRRDALRLRTPVSRPDGAARRRLHRRPLAPPSPSSRKPPAAAPAPPSAPSPRSTTTCACSTPRRQPTAPTAAGPSPARPPSRSSSASSQLAPGERITVYAPIVRGRKGEFREELEAARPAGLPRPHRRRDGDLSEGMRSKSARTTPSKPSSTASSSSLRLPLTETKRCPNPSSYDTRVSKPPSSKALQMANGLVLIGLRGHGRDSSSRPPWPAPIAASTCPSSSRAASQLQLHLRRLPGVPRPGQHLRLRPRQDHHRLVEAAARRRHGPRLRSQYLLKLIKLAAEKYKINLKLPFEELHQSSSTSALRPTAGEAGRTGFHGIFAYLRDTSKTRKPRAIAST
jgi:hypothetical protein